MNESPIIGELQEQFAERILFLDGALGTMVQAHSLEEADFRGKRFQDHMQDLQGNNDILCLTQPDIVQKIHESYFHAGADIIETNTKSQLIFIYNFIFYNSIFSIFDIKVYWAYIYRWFQ